MNCPKCGAELVERQVGDTTIRHECPEEDCNPMATGTGSRVTAAIRRFFA